MTSLAQNSPTTQSMYGGRQYSQYGTVHVSNEPDLADDDPKGQISYDARANLRVPLNQGF